MESAIHGRREWQDALYAGAARPGAFFHHHHADHRPHLHLVEARAYNQDGPRSGEPGNISSEAFTALPQRHNHHHEVSDRRSAHRKGHWHLALSNADGMAAPRVPYLFEIVALAWIVVSDGFNELAGDLRLVIVHPARPPPTAA